MEGRCHRGGGRRAAEYLTWVGGGNATSWWKGREAAPEFSFAALGSHTLGGAVGGVALKDAGRYLVAPAFRYGVKPAARAAGRTVLRELVDSGIVHPSGIRVGRLHIRTALKVVDDAVRAPATRASSETGNGYLGQRLQAYKVWKANAGIQGRPTAVQFRPPAASILDEVELLPLFCAPFGRTARKTLASEWRGQVS